MQRNRFCRNAKKGLAASIRFALVSSIALAMSEGARLDDG